MLVSPTKSLRHILCGFVCGCVCVCLIMPNPYQAALANYCWAEVYAAYVPSCVNYGGFSII